MKPLTIAAAALAVFFLLLSMLISAPAAAPAVGSGMDRCLMCHPKAHPADWTMKSHIADLKSGEVSPAECTRCHDTEYCVTCHAQVQAMKQQPGANTP
jgi:hypothetical protein